MKDLSSKIVAYEQDELNGLEIIELFQELIDNGMAWKLQGHYGRMAMDLIEEKMCTPAMERDDASKECPRCAKQYTGYPSLSRVDNATDICNDCGTDEAMLDFAGTDLPTDWLEQE